MQKLKLSLLSLTFLLLSQVHALSEGKDYITLKTPLSNASNSVTEAFSYACIHCFRQHELNTLGELKKRLPNLSYEVLPVKPMGAYGNEFAKLYAYALAQDKANNLDSTQKQSLSYQLSTAYFTAVFERRQTWNNGKNPQAFNELGYKILGIDKAKLDSFLASKEGNELFMSFDELTQVARNTGTPGFVVNGKYQILLQNIKSFDDFVSVVEGLLKLP